MAVTQVPLTRRRWGRNEYERMVALGMFRGEPIELLGGDLIVSEPQGAYHASAVTRVDYALRAIVPAGWIVRLQAPISLDAESEPEPDLVVVPGRPGDYATAHPGPPSLAVEVADSSLAFDRERKGSLYARAGVPDYWIVNLVDRTLEVHRGPSPDPSAPYRWRYRAVLVLTPPSDVAPIAFPSGRISTAALLP